MYMCVRMRPPALCISCREFHCSISDRDQNNKCVSVCYYFVDPSIGGGLLGDDCNEGGWPRDSESISTLHGSRLTVLSGGNKLEAENPFALNTRNSIHSTLLSTSSMTTPVGQNV